MMIVLPSERSSRSSSRLVEQEHLGVVDERVGEAQPLLHAARQRLDVRIALAGEVDEVEQVADHPPPVRGRDAIAAPEEVEVLPDLHVVIDAERIRHEPEDAADLVGVPDHRVAADLGLAGARFQQRGQDPQRGRLPGAVGPHETEDLARLDREVDAGHGDRPVVALHQSIGSDDRAHPTTPFSSTPRLKLALSISFTKRTSSVPVVGSTYDVGEASA
jgi:hypothetical protein